MLQQHDWRTCSDGEPESGLDPFRLFPHASGGCCGKNDPVIIATLNELARTMF